MSRTFVITGGTDGIGAAVARALFSRGDHVVVIGTNQEKAYALVHEAADSPGSASFLTADLSLMSRTQDTVRELLEAHPRIDGLVLCARYFQTYRRETADGFEHNFALFYLSRLLFSYGLHEALAKAPGAAIINVAGPGNDTPIDWDDLQSTNQFDGVRTMFVTGRFNDLLGVSFAERHGDGPVKYVLFHPGTTSTGFAGEFDAPTSVFIARQKAESKPATAVVAPIVGLLDEPPAQALSAFNMHNRLSVENEQFSSAHAARLTGLTEELLKPITT